MRYYDAQNNRLIYIEQQTTPDYWDNHWQTDGSLGRRLETSKDTFVSRITRKFLDVEDGIILEGGCGWGQHVAALTHQGYRCIGIDYAQKTVQAINQVAPQLDVRVGDVRCLDFEDGYFAGYWSLGVIEHFWNGYEPIALEMARVIKPGGYLFLTFPYMSRLRRFKAGRGSYLAFNDHDQAPQNFYQFGLDHTLVIKHFEAWGFNIVQVTPQAGLKGFKDEVSLLKPGLQKFYDYRGQSFVIRAGRRLLTDFLSPFAGHTVLLVFRYKQPDAL